MSNILKKLGFGSLSFGQIQSIDEMTVVPIVGPDLTDDIALPSELFFEGTSSYGTMRFTNESKVAEGIIPSNTMIISDQSAQDHALTGIEIVPASQTVSNIFACCIQSDQGGLLQRSNDKHYINILPISLRKVCLSTSLRGERSYDKLWDAITDFLKPVPGIQHGSNLDSFFRPFKKELEDFVAEFEPIPDQLGAVILFNESLVGLEIMPTHAYWDTFWKWLLRGCYGAELLYQKKSGKMTNGSLAMPTLPDDLDVALTMFKDHLNNVRSTVVKELDNVTLVNNIVGSSRKKHGFLPAKVKTNYKKTIGGGDIVTQKNIPVYASIVL